jgi:xanthine dehydrogenase large subunit
VEYIGQPIALVVADTKRNAKKALKLIAADIEKLEPMMDPRAAAAAGQIHGKKRVQVNGDPDAAFGKCKHVFEGRLASGPQEHFYFETQRALAVPGEHDTIKVYASAQSPGAFHHHLAEVLGIPMHKVELDIRRLGGGFGGKEPTAVLGRSFLHVCGSYRIPNIRVTGLSCRTNIPPNNAFRGFGVPQGTYAIEAALSAAAHKLGLEPEALKRKNLLKDGDILPYGVKLSGVNSERCWATLDAKTHIAQRRAAVAAYNETHKDTKRGLAAVPVCFGISFAQTALNQASSLVHIYVDGSVAVSTGAVEMGQGVNAKIRIVAARTLGVPLERVRVETTNTSRIPNASPTSASTGADLNGMATKYACERLRARLIAFAAGVLKAEPAAVDIKDGEVLVSGKSAGLGWNKLAKDAQWARVDLGEHAFYATPDLHYDMEKEQGRPFAYYAYGTSLIEVKLDCLRGTYTLEAVDVVQDVGESLSPAIDRGQTEGAVVQGMGWATMEQLRYAPDGRVLTGVSAYKIPDIKFLPAHFDVTLLKDSSNPYAVCNSKAVGEPPFVHGIGAYLAVADALRAARPDGEPPSLPITPEKAFMHLHGGGK